MSEIRGTQGCSIHAWLPPITEKRKYQTAEEHLVGNPAHMTVVTLDREEVLVIRGCRNCAAFTVERLP